MNDADEAYRAEKLARSAQGDESAFADLYDATVSVVYGVVIRLLRSSDLAAEIVQEVYLMAWQQAEKFDPARGTTKAWLCTMAHRRAVDRIRSSTRRRDREEHYQADEQATASEDPTWEGVESGLDSEDVQTGLAQVSEVQRQALNLVYFRGLSHQEVAEHLKIPLGTAKSRIRDGLVSLRTVLGEQW